MSLIVVFILKYILSDVSIATSSYFQFFVFFFLVSIFMEYLFPAPHFQSIYIPRFEVDLL